MKFGVADFGMNGWDGGHYDTKTRLEKLRALGYEGIERLECIDASDAVYKAIEFRRLGMGFATCRAPSVEATMKFSAALGCEYVWLMPGDKITRKIDIETHLAQCNRFVAAAANFGLTAALHNHLGSPVESQEDLDLFMAKCPDAKLLLDIGHLYGAGGDILRTIDQYFDRIAAIHFKDVFIKDEQAGLDLWRERLRFCELGAGNCNEPWREAAQLLKKRGYDKWLFIEQDTHLSEPLDDLKTSLDALKNIFC